MQKLHVMIIASACLLSACQSDLRETVEVQPAGLPEPVADDSIATIAISSKPHKLLAAAELSARMPGVAMPSLQHQHIDREKYANIVASGIQNSAVNPLSTFSIDVDTGSYSNVRRILHEGRLPSANAVRVEEMINYFDYQAPPIPADQPLGVSTEVAATPWNANTRLLRIAVHTRPLELADLKPNNLVFLLDVSGSMHAENKLGLLKKSLKLLSRQLRAVDSVAIVVYAGAAGVALEPVSGDDHLAIESALDQLQAGGSTHGSAGIELAYLIARQAFIEAGNNRVILATDGDFNLGTVNHESLLDMVERNRQQGISLTTLGFGNGNYNDHLMEQLADHGDGNHAYIDSLLEARKVLVDELGATLQTVASDVKIQVEFNPALVSEYRLLGYENRALQAEDFNNDRVDAGEIGAGHAVMAFYELRLASETPSVDRLRYQPDAVVAPSPETPQDELAFVKLRFKPTAGGSSRLLSTAVLLADSHDSLQQASEDFRFASAVAAFAEHLRGSVHLGDFDLESVRTLAGAAAGNDQQGLRRDFVRLVGLVESFAGRPL